MSRISTSPIFPSGSSLAPEAADSLKRDVDAERFGHIVVGISTGSGVLVRETLEGEVLEAESVGATEKTDSVLD